MTSLIDALADLDTPPDTDAPARRLPGQRVDVYLEDGSTCTVRVGTRERIAFERTAARHRDWPAAEAAPLFVMSFCLWSAATRAQETALSFDAWTTAVIDWDVIAEDPADPTR